MASQQRKLKRSGQSAEQAFKHLIEAILDGDFPGGARLREVRLAREWKIGRTPLREAMRRAAENGFVVLRPNHTPIVRLLSEDDIRNIYELREVLELHAFHKAWPNITARDVQSLENLAARAKPKLHRNWRRLCFQFDVDLHQLWSRRCGNEWLARDLQRHYQLLRIFINWIGHDMDALIIGYEDHVNILKAVKEHNQQAALDLLRSHIRLSAKEILNTVVDGHIGQSKNVDAT